MRISRLVGLLLAACLTGSNGWAADKVRVETFWLQPDVPRGAQPYRVPAMLHLPLDWVNGDGAVILLPAPGARFPEAVPRGLLAQGVLVLELDLAESDGSAEAVQSGLATALEQLRYETGAGSAVVIGTGARGPAALEAASSLPQVAVGVALGETGAVVRATGSEAQRSSLGGLCQALAAQGRQALEACREALFGAPTHAAR